MTLLLAVLADLGLGRTVASLVALLVALTASASELARLGAVGLGVTLFALDTVSQASRGRADDLTQLKQAPIFLGSGHSRAKWPSATC